MCIIIFHFLSDKNDLFCEEPTKNILHKCTTKVFKNSITYAKNNKLEYHKYPRATFSKMSYHVQKRC
jgi:hypothetical protein